MQITEQTRARPLKKGRALSRRPGSGPRLSWCRWASSLRHVVEETAGFAVGGPFGPKPRAALDAAQSRQQEPVELACVIAAHPTVDVEAVGGRNDGPVDELFQKIPYRVVIVRADIGDKVKRGISHNPSLPGQGQD